MRLYRRSVKTCAVMVAASGAITAGLLSGGGGAHVPALRSASLSMTPMQLRLLSGASEQALVSLGVLQAQAAGRPDAELGRDNEGNGTAPGTRTGPPIGPGGSGGGSSVFPGLGGSASRTRTAMFV